MKKILTAAVSAMMFLFVAGGAATAQEEETDEMQVVPVETWACNYRDGKGPGDLSSDIDAWKEWMDSN